MAASPDSANTPDDLSSTVYAQLRAIAGGLLREERAGHTLQPTALVHEAWMRLAGSHNLRGASREQFFAAAAVALRRVLVDHARARAAAKRGGAHAGGDAGLEASAERGPAIRVALDAELLPAPASESDAGGVDAAALGAILEDFGAQYPRQLRVVELRFFAGWTIERIAEDVGVSVRTVANDWDFAKAWLRTRLGV